MRATEVYAHTTARNVSGKMIDWITELVERFGDETVCAAIEAEAPKGDMRGLLGRARDRMARAAVAGQHHGGPVELTRDQLLAWVRGTWEPEKYPVIYDCIGMSAEEYREVLAWVGHNVLDLAPGDQPAFG